ncbi:MAG: hypothetical protein HQK89_16910 [Nitrospirae bacterium]|nr:hypothetical protein [Nitrospirota bacterium]
MAKEAPILDPKQLRAAQLDRASRIEIIIRRYEKNLEIGNFREYLDLVRLQEFLLNPTGTQRDAQKLPDEPVTFIVDFGENPVRENQNNDVHVDVQPPGLGNEKNVDPVSNGAIVVDKDAVVRSIMAEAAETRREYCPDFPQGVGE